MTYVSVVMFAAYGLVLVLLAAIAIVDVRERRIPNMLSGGLVALWLLWRIVLGLAGRHMGLGFRAEFLGPAPTVVVPPGLEVLGDSFAGGIIGAVILGGGLLVLTALYEAVTHKQSFGGGDIKLMAALGLFLGAERGLVCLLAACLLSVLFALARAGVRRVRGCRAGDGEELPSAVAPRRGTGSAVDSSVLSDTLPFAPFIAFGTLAAFVA